MTWSEIVEQAPNLVVSYGINIVFAIAIFLVGKWVAKRVVFWVTNLMLERGFDPTACGFVANIAYVLSLVMLAVAALSQLGMPTTSFVAAIGAAGLAIGLALQGSLSNFASGVLLVTLQPCKAGDFIETNGLSGTVEQITMFSTTLVTGDQRTITVPNAQLFSAPITNYSTSPTRRLDMIIGISYDADINAAKEVLRATVEADPRVLQDPEPVIGVLALADSSVNIAVRPWLSNDDYWAARFDLHEKIKLALDEAGIEIPYPHVAVHMQGGAVSQA